MHLSDDVLQAYLDGEMPDAEIEKTKQHLVECDICRQSLSIAQQRSESNRARFDALSPRVEEQTQDAGTLLAQIEAKRHIQPLRQRSRWSSAWAAVLAIVALVAALNLEPVRVWAAEFLSLFRVQQIAVIRFDPANLQQHESGLFGAESERRLEQLLSDDAHVSKRGDTQTVQNVNDAARIAGFGIKMPTAISAPSRIQVHPAVDASFDIDVERLQGILDEAGRTDIKIPEDIDGEMIRVNVPASVTALFGNCPDPKTKEEAHERQDYEAYADCKIFVQLPAPTVVAPPSLNITKLGAEMLKLFGFTEEQAKKLSESIDWSTTLVVPLPIDRRMDVLEVDVNGGKAQLFIKRERGTEDVKAYNLLWIRDGILYAFMGRGTAEEAIAIANSL